MKPSMKKWCYENSRPKIYPNPPKINRGKTNKLQNLLPRINMMCQPRKDIGVNWTRDYLKISSRALRYRASTRIRNLSELPERLKFKDPRYDPCLNWYLIMKISDKAKQYVASERIKRMAQPNHPRKKYRPTEETFVKKSALSYNATARINSLAQPRRKGKKYKPRKERFVKKSALSGKASARTSALAKHVVRKDTINRKNPYAVNKKALEYKSTPRVDKLATPSHVTPKFTPDSERHKEYMENRDAEAEQRRNERAKQRKSQKQQR